MTGLAFTLYRPWPTSIRHSDFQNISRVHEETANGIWTAQSIKIGRGRECGGIETEISEFLSQIRFHLLIHGKLAFIREVYPERIVFSRYSTNSNAFPESFPGKNQELFIIQVDAIQSNTEVCLPSANDYKALCLPFQECSLFLPISHSSKFVNVNIHTKFRVISSSFCSILVVFILLFRYYDPTYCYQQCHPESPTGKPTPRSCQVKSSTSVRTYY